MREGIRLCAERLIKKYGTSNPEELCRELGIPIMLYDLPEVTNGFCLTLSQGSCIVINKNLSKAERSTALAHELGHAVLHKEFNFMFMTDHTNMVTGRFEREADYFAAALKLGKREYYSGFTLEEIASRYALPLRAVEEYFSEDN